VPERKLSFSLISASDKNFNPQNTNVFLWLKFSSLALTGKRAYETPKKPGFCSDTNYKCINLMSSKTYPLRWYDYILLKVFSPIIALLIKLLLLSCRKTKVEGHERAMEIIRKSEGKAIYTTWHQRMVYLGHILGPKHVTTMISQSRDGEYAARIAKWLGFKNVRGSSTRGGAYALKKIIKDIKAGETTWMLTDGPTGPARKAKKGAIFLARSTGAPIIPILWSADRCWTLNSWDRYLIPKPFARVVIKYSEPILIPKSIKKDHIEEYRLLLEEALNQETLWCDKQFGKERPWHKEAKQ